MVMMYTHERLFLLGVWSFVPPPALDRGKRGRDKGGVDSPPAPIPPLPSVQGRGWKEIPNPEQKLVLVSVHVCMY